MRAIGQLSQLFLALGGALAQVHRVGVGAGIVRRGRFIRRKFEVRRQNFQLVGAVQQLGLVPQGQEAQRGRVEIALHPLTVGIEDGLIERVLDVSRFIIIVLLPDHPDGVRPGEGAQQLVLRGGLIQAGAAADIRVVGGQGRHKLLAVLHRGQHHGNRGSLRRLCGRFLHISRGDLGDQLRGDLRNSGKPNTFPFLRTGEGADHQPEGQSQRQGQQLVHFHTSSSSGNSDRLRTSADSESPRQLFAWYSNSRRTASFPSYGKNAEAKVHSGASKTRTHTSPLPIGGAELLSFGFCLEMNLRRIPIPQTSRHAS